MEQTIVANQAGEDAAAAAAGLTRKPRAEGTRKPRAEAPNRNHGALPAHLPRYEVVIDIEDQACPCCGHALHAIGELRTGQLDMVPSQLRVRVTRRPRYACHGCESAVVVARAPIGPLTAACRPKRSSRTWWSPSSRTHCRCIAKRRCWNDRASSWTARRWRTGSDGRAGG